MKIKFVALAIACMATVANAEVRHFKFVGTVTESLPMAPIGAKVIGHFSYDTSATPEMTLGDPSGQSYSSSSYSIARAMTVKVNGHTLVSASTHVDVVNNFGGNIEDSIGVFGSPMTLDGTLFSEGLFGIFLGSGPGKTHVLNDTDLPRKIRVQNFDGMNYGVVQVNGGPDGALLAFSVESVNETHSRDED